VVGVVGVSGLSGGDLVWGLGADTAESVQILGLTFPRFRVREFRPEANRLRASGWFPV